MVRELPVSGIICHIGERYRGLRLYTKTLGPPKVYMFNGRGYHEMASEGVRAISGPHEIQVDAEFWKGGSPKEGAIELAKKLAG
jgi:hypothetical protein